MPNEQNMYVYVNRDVDRVIEEEFKMFNEQIVHIVMSKCSFLKGDIRCEKRSAFP